MAARHRRSRKRVAKADLPVGEVIYLLEKEDEHLWYTDAERALIAFEQSNSIALWVKVGTEFKKVR